MDEQIVRATESALRLVAEPRFLRTERGFQGQFYCALQHVLYERGLVPDGGILEMEYQKSARHCIGQRPDIVLHVPAEDSGARVDENNFAVWALKRRASRAEAVDDFEKLDEMFKILNYPLGVFVNVDAAEHYAADYAGGFGDRLRMVAVWLEEHGPETRWGRP